MMKDQQAAVQEFLDFTHSLYSDRHVFRQIEPTQFPNVKQSYYDIAQAAFEHIGFTKFCDLEDITYNDTVPPKERTYVRVLLSQDHTIIAGLYYTPVPLWKRIYRFLGLMSRQPDFFIDLETEFSDGTFLITTTASATLCFVQDPRIQQNVCDHKIPLPEMLQTHYQHLKDWASHQQSTPLEAHTLEDMINCQHRLQDLKNEHRQALGYITPEEVEHIANGRYQNAVENFNASLEQIQSENDL